MRVDLFSVKAMVLARHDRDIGELLFSVGREQAAPLEILQVKVHQNSHARTLEQVAYHFDH